MGCIQARPSFTGNWLGLEKLQPDHSQVKGGGRRRRDGPIEPKIETVISTIEKKKNKKKRIIGDEDIKGWPKWLVDNISRETLAGFVPRSADSYEKLAKVGHGTYSNVYKARDRKTKRIVALKKVRFDTTEPESVKFMAREITILRKLDHPNVVKLRGLATSRMQFSLYLVFDFMHADLNKLLSRSGLSLDEAQVKFYMHQLLSGLRHCHERGVLHRDIKPSNLLLDKTGTLKIADFGLSTLLQPKLNRPLTSRVVTLWYRAPELLLGSADYGIGIDLWSSGCLLAEMFIGRPFIAGRTEVEQLHKIFKLCGSPLDEFWKKMKLPMSFRPPQHYKPSFNEAFKEFPKSSFHLLTQLLALEPTSRGTADSALHSDFFSASPVACDVSALPVIEAEEDEPIEANDMKKPLSSNSKKSIQMDREHLPKFNEKKSYEAKLNGQKMDNSGNLRNTSSSNKQTRIEYRIFSPINLTSNQEPKGICSRSEAHPSAMKNIDPEARKSFSLLHDSVSNTTTQGDGSALAHYFKSFSALDFRNHEHNVVSE